MHICAAGYVYATAQTLAHVDLHIQVNPRGWTVTNIPATAVVYGDCTALPAVAMELNLGVDQAKLGIGLAAALLSGFPFIGWSVSVTYSLYARAFICFVQLDVLQS